MYGLLVVVGAGVVAATEAPSTDALRLEVQRLVRQLDALALAQREAAEAALIGLGPEVLPLLPEPTERTPAEVRFRLQRVRQTLYQAAARAALESSRVSLRLAEEPLSKALRAMQEQTGNRIVDARARFCQDLTDPPVSVELDSVPFWSALDQVVDAAGLAIYPFADERAIWVVARGEGELPRCGRAYYAGPFRIEPSRIEALRDLRQQASASLRLTLQVAWEPRLLPITLKLALGKIEAWDDSGEAIGVRGPDTELEAPTQPDTAAVEMPIPFLLPPRHVRQIARLRGVLGTMVAGKVETFRFTEIGREAAQRIAQATVALLPARRSGEAWELRVVVRLDEAGDALASHRGWIYQNQCRLEKPGAEPLRPERFETFRHTASEVGVAYFFALEGDLAGWTLVYQTPGMVFRHEFPFELTGIDLP